MSNAIEEHKGNKYNSNNYKEFLFFLTKDNMILLSIVEHYLIKMDMTWYYL